MYVLGYSGFTRDSRKRDGYRNPFAKTHQDFESVFTFHEGEVPFQMFPLGFFGHDAAAALLHDGELVACAAEERFTRAKYSLNLAGNTLLPTRAIAYCLETAGIGIDDVDVVAHYCHFDMKAIEARRDLIAPFVSRPEVEMIDASYRSVYAEMMDLPVLLRQFEHMTGARPRRFVQVPHHLAHAASAYYPSGFDEALIFTIDGTGECESSLLAVGRGGAMAVESRVMLPDSLGTLYLLVTVLLGFKTLGDEYKVMGLAGYGDAARFHDFFRSLVRLLPNGTYTLDGFARGDLRHRLAAALGPPHRRGEEITQRHCDVAAALQESLEAAVLHVLTHARRRLGMRHLCMAGGVALNSMMNGVIARAGLFSDIFVQPAAGDEGGGLGAALYAWHQTGRGQVPATRLRQVYAGPAFDSSAIEAALEPHRDTLSWRTSEQIVEDVAEELAGGKVIGWFQGRMEFGPRALGNRSILADPRPTDMKERINEKVKHREGFRPFAPAVTEEDAADFFDMTGLRDSPFMLFVVPVHESVRDLIPAVTHVDGTARVQTVSRETNEKFWKLIRAFGQRSGVPILLNTSFNVMNEPIVCTPEDAIRCFLHTDIDLLVLGDFIVMKQKRESAP
ncbi:MAG: nodulation protein [Bacteroidetes bacterium]|nr:nodulation protein [Bacteroidota bacterium]